MPLQEPTRRRRLRLPVRVPMPLRDFKATDAGFLTDAFQKAYARFFGRAIDGLDGMEIDGLVGTLAGDDTAFLAMKDATAADAFENEIEKLL